MNTEVTDHRQRSLHASGGQGSTTSDRSTRVDIVEFEQCKLCLAHAGHVTYQLRACQLWVCSECGAHYIDYLDPAETPDTTASRELTDRERNYFRKTQHYNLERNAVHVDMVRSYVRLEGLRILDIGCGGGLFLSHVKALGADVCGLDSSPAAVLFSREESGVDAHNVLIEDPDWQVQNKGAFDVVTLWDVIEHVNFPRETILAAAHVLRPGGHIFVGTPCRDTFYHRVGTMTYALTHGRFPTFLNQLYSSERFAHKQILSTADIAGLYRGAGVELQQLDLLHELSLPYKHYLKKLTRSDVVATITAPFARLAFSIFRIKNKMIAVGRKR